MAQVTVHIHGKPYILGCEDGEEDRLRALASNIDAKVRAVDPGGGALGETRLMLMGALILADEASAATERLVAAEQEVARLHAQLAQADSRAVAAIEAAAKQIEAIASR
jgi:cell division protein ZapA